jgi:hypothetical protein
MKVYAKLFVLATALFGLLMTSQQQTGAQNDPCQENCNANQ